MSLLSIISNPLNDMLKSASEIISRFVPDPQAKLAANLELAKLAQQSQQGLIDAEKAYVAAQSQVITAEVQSQSWMARNWRPLLMLTFTYIIAHNFVIAPLFSIHAVDIPPNMWELLKLGMGGYIIGRSAEKIVPDVAAILKK